VRCFRTVANADQNEEIVRMNEPAVAYVAFNRPDLTRRSFGAIREFRPKRLFLICDGPREANVSDEFLCTQVRQILSSVDWPCDVSTDFAEKNMGCKARLVSGLNWVFSNVESAIIIEDDCVAGPSFFSFCKVLLDRYANEKAISVVTGNNFQQGIARGDYSYYFSRINTCWGWATWRRAWAVNDPNIEFWPSWKASDQWRMLFRCDKQRLFWEAAFDKSYANEIDTWDFAWTASVWRNGGLTIAPNVNLVANVGFDRNATHTKQPNPLLSGLATGELERILHPSEIIVNEDADDFVFNTIFDPPRRSRLRRIALKIQNTFVRLSV